LVLLGRPESPAELLHSVDVALGGESTPPGQPDVFTMIGLGAQILRSLGVGKMRLLGKPMRYNAISGFGLEVVECLSDSSDPGQGESDARD